MAPAPSGHRLLHPALPQSSGGFSWPPARPRVGESMKGSRSWSPAIGLGGMMGHQRPATCFQATSCSNHGALGYWPTGFPAPHPEWPGKAALCSHGGSSGDMFVRRGHDGVMPSLRPRELASEVGAGTSGWPC